MDSSKSDKDAKISLLYNQANQAFDRGDKRASAMLIHKILSQEITHTAAWRLLYMMLGEDQPFNKFQQAFAQKYYPAQAHQLAPPIAPSTTNYINDGIQAVAPYPVDNQNNILFCPRCGHERAAESRFCQRCGLQFAPGNVSAASPAAHVPLPTRESPPPPSPVTTTLFTPKRVVAAIGLLIILLSGLLTWSTTVDVEFFTPG